MPSSLYDLGAASIGLRYSDEQGEPPVKEEAKDYLRWRRHEDAEEEDSLSDWTIQVVTTTSSTTTATAKSTQRCGEAAEVVKTYHVHRYALASGPRRSEYFTRLFQQDGRFAESQNSTSRIELDELAAKAFPVLLDFLYAPPHVMEVPFTTENATALYSLAKYFDVPRLQWLAVQFWSKDIQSSKTCGMYYEHAKILQEDYLLQVAIRAMGEHVLGGDETANASLLNLMKSSGDDDVSVSSLDPSDARRYLLDAQFWWHYLRSVTITTDMSLKLSLLLAEFFRCSLLGTCEMAMLWETLTEFTAPKYLPQIHIDAALLLMDIERKVIDDLRIVTLTVLTGLQDRCMQALAQNWDRIDLNEEPHKTLLQQQPAHVISKIYLASLAAAKVDKQKMALERDRYLAQCRQHPYFSFGNAACSAGHPTCSSNIVDMSIRSFREPRLLQRPSNSDNERLRFEGDPPRRWHLPSNSNDLPTLPGLYDRHGIPADRHGLFLQIASRSTAND